MDCCVPAHIFKPTILQLYYNVHIVLQVYMHAFGKNPNTVYTIVKLDIV